MTNTTMQWKEARGRVALSLRLLFLLGSHSECAWIFWPWHSDRCTCFITFPFLPFVSCAFFLAFCARFRSVPSHPPLSHFVYVCVTWQMCWCACGTVGPQVAAGLCVCLCVWDSYWCSGVQELFIGAFEWWAWRHTQAPHTVNVLSETQW